LASNTSNTNVRMPELMTPGEYPYVRFTQFRDGSWRREDETPNNESQGFGHILGTFEETDNSSGHKHLKVGQSFHYAALGHTDTVDYNSHNKTGGSTVGQVSQDHHQEHGGDRWHATYGDNIHATRGLHYSHGTGGVSHSSTGDKVSDHNDGNDHHNVQGDQISFVGGVKYENVNSESGSFVGGNHDMLVNGNFQQTTNKTMKLNANQSIIVNATSNIVHTTANQYANVNYLIVNNAQNDSILMVGNTSQNTYVNSTTIDVMTLNAGQINMGDPVLLVNTTMLNIGTLVVSSNGSNGLGGQVLTSNSQGVYWDYSHTQPAGNDQWIQINEANALGAFATFTFDYVNNNLTVSNGIYSNFISVNQIIANNGNGSNGQVLTSDGTGRTYWANGQIASLAAYQTIAGLNANIAIYLPNYTGVLNSSSVSVSGNATIGGSLIVGNTVVINSTSTSGLILDLGIF
jgi:hypothetical protein